MVLWFRFAWLSKNHITIAQRNHTLQMQIRPLQKKDWNIVRRIYQEGIDTGMATFETQVPDWETWDLKFLKKCRIVAEREGEVLGWATLSATSKREVYRGVAEVSIYVDLDCTQKGIGSVLMSALIKSSEEEKFWTLQSSVFTENKGSILLHEKFGFRVVGHREKIAKRDGEWKDTILLERRSNLII